jgi:hypothetical protein
MNAQDYVKTVGCQMFARRLGFKHNHRPIKQVSSVCDKYKSVSKQYSLLSVIAQLLGCLHRRAEKDYLGWIQRSVDREAGRHKSCSK